MQITLHPQRRDAPLALARSGDTLTVNGAAFDFSGIPEGATLPADAIASDLFCGPVERIDGVLHLHLVLPHGPAAPDETRFPAPLALTADGPVDLPASGEREGPGSSGAGAEARAAAEPTAIDWSRMVTAAGRAAAARTSASLAAASQARTYLAATDWYLVRRVETGEPVPDEVLAKRRAARARAGAHDQPTTGWPTAG